MSGVPIHLTIRDNTATCTVGRSRTPIADADAGIQAAFDRAITNHDGSVDGPLVDGRWILDGDRLVTG